MNRYLEKVAELEKEALNALKARAMAHEAGVVVDPDTQWKWALRQFRGKRGELVQGRERSQVLNRLMGNPAAGNNNFRQAIQSEQRKLRPREEVQLIREGYRKGQIGLKDIPARNVDVKLNLSNDVESPLINKAFGTNVDTHVHPGYEKMLYKMESARSMGSSLYRDVNFRTTGGPHRLASPSGLYSANTPGSGISTALGWTVPNKEARINILNKGDLGLYAHQKNMVGKPANILTPPSEGGNVFLGTHRVIPAGLPTPVKLRELSKERGFKGLRSAYLDLTPRKARPANPYLDKLHDMGKTL